MDPPPSKTASKGPRWRLSTTIKRIGEGSNEEDYGNRGTVYSLILWAISLIGILSPDSLSPVPRFAVPRFGRSLHAKRLSN